MILSIGIDYSRDLWKTCVLEDGHDPECSSFVDTEHVLAYLRPLCVSYPESIMLVASPLTTPFVSLHELIEKDTLSGVQSADSSAVSALAAAFYGQNLRSYHLPSIRNLPAIPRHRQLIRQQMGRAATLCSVATLFYRMRQRAATWSEMNFLYLEVTDAIYSILVVQNGFIVDGLTEAYGASGPLAEKDQSRTADLVELAFWEGLTRDLAGLQAIHQQTDIVIRELATSASAPSRQDDVIKRFDDEYQFFLFPVEESEPSGFEAAGGAALLAEGLFRKGATADVIQQLLPALPLSEKF